MTLRIRGVSALVMMMTACAGEPGPPALETFREVCAPYFACDCEDFWFRDVEGCMEYHHAAFAEAMGAARAAGLRSDLECYIDSERPGEDRCLGHTAYHDLHPLESPREPNRCGECQAVFGERQVGEPCLEISVTGSDCAQGLLCQGAPGVCVDPCTPIAVGERCFFGTTICGPGRYCDHDREVCLELAGVGGPCTFNDECVEGLVCGPDDLCVAAAGAGEACDRVDCQAGLACVPVDGLWVCGAVPGEGEPCGASFSCAEGLFCGYPTNVCERYSESGGSCAGSMRCAEGLDCESEVCRSAPGEGEPCEVACELGFECEDAVCVREVPLLCPS
jgi:hypothetical protein